MKVEKAEGSAYPEPGPKSICGMCVRDFPCFVINDIHKTEVTL